MSFMTDPEAMRDYARRFDTHAEVVHTEARGAMSAAESASGGIWKGTAEGASMDSIAQMAKAFAKIEEMMRWASDNLNRSATEYETTQHENTTSLQS